MPFEFAQSPRVAVIGSGVSGLSAAYELGHCAQVTLFEADDRLGGHARTVMAGRNSDIAVDTGFIVFNYQNYPEMTRMFKELDVPVTQSDMGFSTSIGGGEIEYSLRSLRSLMAQRRNLLRPGFYRMLLDIGKFIRNAETFENDPNLTVGEMIETLGLGEWFRRYYLLPMAGAIWSSTPEQMADFPAMSLVQFFRNHALLSPKGHQWFTVKGGSIEYVNRISAAISQSGGDIRLSTPVKSVRRDLDGVEIFTAQAGWERFDQVIFACHSDQAIALLDKPTPQELSSVGAISYQPNEVVLHRDARQMPKRKSVWAAWVFKTEDFSPRPKIGLTYWMNALQNIDKDEPLFISLNPREEIPDDLVYDRAQFDHPVFDRTAIHAQKEISAIQGMNATWYAGAYTRWGFHEDGYASGVKVAKDLIALQTSQLERVS